MEILKFSEPPRRGGRSRANNKSGLMPLVSFGIAVLVLGGMSTTLAGTISLGSGDRVEFGQGIVTAAACDPSITLTPSTTYSDDTFTVTQLVLSGIGVASTDTTTAGGAGGTDAGCGGKSFVIKAYTSTGELLNVANESTTATRSFVGFTLPSYSNLTASDAAQPTAYTLDSNQSVGNFSRNGASNWLQLASAGTGSVTITGIRISSTVTRFTLESTSTS